MVKQKHYVSDVRLEFEHVSLRLPAEKASWGQRLSALLPSSSQGRQQSEGKQLLNDVNGQALPGRMLAIMGPSGAGKTTLLGVLAGDSAAINSGKLTGRVLLGGQERKLEKFRQISAHVKQDDILLPTTTPREALQFAAALRLPTPYHTQQQQEAAVLRLIDGMKLENCADTLVGDATAGMKGLSGGERRRLANAVELLGGPAVFLSDEPTSGQDSSTAVQVLQYMKHQINGAGGVLVITLHQPGSEVSALVDDLLLLGYGGSPVFMGPWGAAMQYFTGYLGLHLPPHTGLADWLLALLDKEAHQQQDLQMIKQKQQQLFINKTHSSFLTLSSSGGSSSYTADSRSSSINVSGGGAAGAGAGVASAGGGGKGVGSIVLHAHSGSSSGSSGGSYAAESGQTTPVPPSTMAAAWQRYVSSGKAAAAAAPYYVAADAATFLEAGLDFYPLGGHHSQLPGLSEITEASTDDDADIIITTIVVDSMDQPSASGSGSGSATLPSILPVTQSCSISGSHHSNSNSPGPTPRSGVVLAAAAADTAAGAAKAKRSWKKLNGSSSSISSRISSKRGSVGRASLGVQVRVLSGRALKWWLRNPAMLLSEALQYLFVVLFLGSLYPRLSTSGQAAAADRLAALYLWLTCIMVTTPARALLSWDQERRLLRHEMSSGLYSLTPFLLGTKLLVSLPLEVAVVAGSGALLYVLVGFQAVAAKFWAFMALSVFLAVCAANLGNAICLVMTDMHFKLPALCITATLLLAFAGFVVQAIPVWWTWLGHASFCTYAYAGLVRNEFEQLSLQLPLGAAASTVLRGATAGDAMRASLAKLGFNSLPAAAAALTSGSEKLVAVDGMSLVPKTVNVHRFGHLGGFIGVGAAFALGSSVFVLLMTVLVVRLRRQ